MIEYKNGIENNGKVILFLYGGYHSNCTITMDGLSLLANKFTDYLFVKCNTSRYHNVKNKYGVNRLPAVILLNDGNVIDQISGSINNHIVSNLIKRNYK